MSSEWSAPKKRGGEVTQIYRENKSTILVVLAVLKKKNNRREPGPHEPQREKKPKKRKLGPAAQGNEKKKEFPTTITPRSFNLGGKNQKKLCF